MKWSICDASISPQKTILQSVHSTHLEAIKPMGPWLFFMALLPFFFFLFSDVLGMLVSLSAMVKMGMLCCPG